ncbi:MAG: hypothetical protein ABI651_18260, partial [Verrucomicrobiota bacterium]
MRQRIVFVSFLFALTTAYSDPFGNLGFDEVNGSQIIFTPPNPAPFDGYGPVEDLLPGWQITAGTNQYTLMGYQLKLDTTPTPPPFTSTYILGPELSLPSFPIEGGYALAVGGQLEPTSLLQRGDIPSDARWLCYSFAGYPFDVSINGRQLPYPGFRYPAASRTEVRFDISAYAGQNVELELTMVDAAPFFDYRRHDYLDSIEFILPLVVESDFNGDGASDIVFEHP